MDPQLITALITIAVMLLGGWVMLRGGRRRAQGTPAGAPLPFDRALTMSLVAAVAFQFFVGRVPNGTLSTSTALLGATGVVILVAFFPATRSLVSVAALGVFIIDNYLSLGLRGIAFIGFILLVSIVAHLIAGR